MLVDADCMGKVKWMGPDDNRKKPPRYGWTLHDALALCSSGLHSYYTNRLDTLCV